MVGPYRPIKPAADRLPYGDGDESQPSPPPDREQAKRTHSQVQACNTCRQAKSKCDGVRPVCGRCAQRKKACGYAADEKRSQDASVKARLDALDAIFLMLQREPPEAADQLLQRIRVSDDVEQVARDLRVHPAPAVSDPTISNSEAHWDHSLEDGVTANQLPTPDDNAVTNVVRGSHIKLSLPDARTAAKSIETFYGCSGRLFHAFPREDALGFWDTVYTRGSKEPNVIATACLSAIVACGATYSSDPFVNQQVSVRCYDVARHHFEAVIEEDPLSAIRMCTLLAMFNIMTKQTVALTYVEIGLSMARQYRIGGSNISEAGPASLLGVSRAQWLECRNSWRTLMFYSSWLSFTLGYISGNDTMFPRPALSEFDVPEDADLAEIVQAEMTKIAMLKADILRMHLVFKNLSVLAVNSIKGDLEAWYDALPAPMQFRSLASNGLPDGIWTSICHVHLLHLGAIMLLHRRIVSQFVQPHGLDQEDGFTSTPYDEGLLDKLGDGIVAAEQSARILNLLLERRWVYKRCWLSIFQSYTSCIALLHSVVQKQIHGFPKTAWEDELERGKMALTVVKYCGTLDPVAFRFQQRLEPIYSSLAHYESAYVHQFAPRVKDAFLLTVPPEAPEDRIAISATLLSMLCRPFTSTEDMMGSEEDIKNILRDCPYLQQHSLHIQVMDQLQWNFESSLPFHWNVRQLAGHAIPEVDQVHHRFLGDAQPSAWERNDSMQVDT